MANIIKIDNAVLKRFKRAQSKKREQDTRNKIAYFLIVCEGEKTEPNYFKSFEKDLKSYVVDADIEGKGENTLKLVETCINIRKQKEKLGRKYDRVWVVFDRDSFKAVQFNNAIAKAEANGIRVAWSNEAFELWYLLHFDHLENGMNRKEYKSKLEEKINDQIAEILKRDNIKKFRYKKNDPNMYAILEKYGDQKQAIKRAGDLLKIHNGTKYHTHNPCTKVYLLVQELNGDSDELKCEIEQKSNNN